MGAKYWLLRLSPPAIAAAALISSLSAPDYGQFSYPYRAQIQPLFEQWRNQAPTNAPSDCATPNAKSKPVSLQGWAWLKQQKIEDLTPEKLVQVLGNPACLTTSQGRRVVRYFSGFSDAQVEISLDKNGIKYRLQTPSAGMGTQPRQVVGGSTTPPTQPSDR